MSLKWPFAPQKAKKLGNGFSLDDVKIFSENFKREIKTNSSKQKDALSSKFIVNDEIRNGEFFGIERIYKLIELAENTGKGISGIRVYYGLAYEHLKESEDSEISTGPIEKAKDSELRPRLFLVAVDEEGKDIQIDHTGFKDVPDGNGLGNGSPQPPYGNG